MPVRAQRARDRVEDDRAAQAADVDGARRGLGVVDDLRAADRARARPPSPRLLAGRGPMPAPSAARDLSVMLTIL